MSQCWPRTWAQPYAAIQKYRDSLTKKQLKEGHFTNLINEVYFRYRADGTKQELKFFHVEFVDCRVPPVDPRWKADCEQALKVGVLSTALFAAKYCMKLILAR